MKLLMPIFLLLVTHSVLAEPMIKLVSSFPRTGSANGETSTMVNGIKMALAEANNTAGGYTIVYEDWDDASPERGAWDPALEAANADKAIKDQMVVGYIGPYNSGAAKISAPKLNQARLLQISPAATWPGLTKPGKGEPNEPRIYRPSGKISFFRVVPADDLQGDVAARWAKELGTKKVFILHDRELYGKGIADVFQKVAKEIGIHVAGFEGIDAKASNYRSLATKIRQQNPELVYFGGTVQSNAGQLAKDLRSGGFTGNLMLPDGCFQTAMIESAGKDALEGKTFITFGGLPGSKLTGKGRLFFEAYREKYGADPEGYAVYGYEAAKVFLDILNRAKSSDRETIITAAANTKNFQGALGTWSFDENGDTTLKTMSGNTVRNGSFEFVKLLGE